MSQKIKELSSLTPETIVETLSGFAIKTTQKSKVWLEANPGSKLTEDFIEFPGKMDHLCCVCFKVSSH